MLLLNSQSMRDVALSLMDHLAGSNGVLDDDYQAKADQMMLDMGAVQLVADMLCPRYVQGEEVEANIGMLHVASL